MSLWAGSEPAEGGAMRMRAGLRGRGRGLSLTRAGLGGTLLIGSPKGRGFLVGGEAARVEARLYGRGRGFEMEGGASAFRGGA